MSREMTFSKISIGMAEIISLISYLKFGLWDTDTDEVLLTLDMAESIYEGWWRQHSSVHFLILGDQIQNLQQGKTGCRTVNKSSWAEFLILITTMKIMVEISISTTINQSRKIWALAIRTKRNRRGGECNQPWIKGLYLIYVESNQSISNMQTHHVF